MKHEKLLAKLNSFQVIDNSCKKVYCTTCGGISQAITSNMTPKLSNEINNALTEMSVRDFKSLGEWCEYLKINYPFSVHAIYERESKLIDTSDIRQLDHYLFHSRELMKNSQTYRKLLERGINAAIETSDDSLIETLSIILGEKILSYDTLFQLALIKSKTNKDIHRVLYNNLREKAPQVRGFVGDGTTSIYG